MNVEDDNKKDDEPDIYLVEEEEDDDEEWRKRRFERQVYLTKVINILDVVELIKICVLRHRIFV